MVTKSEIIKNDIFRYNFIEKFIEGKILDHKPNIFTSYNSAKILLEKKVTEVNLFISLSDNEFTTRSKNNKNIIKFQIKKNINLKENFDSVISFQNLNEKNSQEYLKFYHNVLKNNGILILSVSNKRKNSNDENQFDLNELKNIIKTKFEIIEVYGHRFKTKPVINYKAVMFRTAKKKLASVLAKADKAKEFYKKNIKTTVSKHDPYKEYFHKIPDEDFIPKKYVKKSEPIFLILICKKIKL
jgi:SAM-dependent methyltransferase